MRVKDWNSEYEHLKDLFLSQHQVLAGQSFQVFRTDEFEDESYNLKSVKITQGIDGFIEDISASIEIDNFRGDYNETICGKEIRYIVGMSGGNRGEEGYGKVLIPAITVFRGFVGSAECLLPEKLIRLENESKMKELAKQNIASSEIFQNLSLYEALCSRILFQKLGLQYNIIRPTQDDSQLLEYFWYDGDISANIRLLVEANGGAFYYNDFLEYYTFSSDASLGRKLDPNYRGTHGFTIHSLNCFEVKKEEDVEAVRNEIVVKIHKFAPTETHVLWSATGQSILGTGVYPDPPHQSWVADFNLQTIGQEIESSSVPCISVCQIQPYTDYVVNTHEDGSGGDMTGHVTVGQQQNYVKRTFFDLWSDIWGELYLTKLQVRGKPLIDSVTSMTFTDAASIAAYGTRSHVLDNIWIQGLTQAEKIGNIILDKYKKPATKIKVRMPFFPMVQVNDVVGLSYPGIDPWGYLVEYTEHIKEINRAETTLILGRTICGLTEV